MTIRKPSTAIAISAGALALPVGALTLAHDDDALIALWLRRPNLSQHTIRSCRKEAERFILWLRAAGLDLRAARYEHLLAYAEFIAAPSPAEQWIATGKFARTDERWRPFLGPLAEVSQRQALIIIKGLFAWARAADYLAANPAELLGSLSLTSDDEVSRFLPPIAISLLYAAADQLPAERPAEQLRRARARFTIAAYYLTAARLSELAGANMGSIRRDHKGAWWVHILGKGKKAGKVPASDELVTEFKRYRLAFGLAALPAPRDPLPLLLSTRGPLRRAKPFTVAKSIKRVMAIAVDLALQADLPEVADRIAQASPHWLRHSSLTHQVDAGAPLKTVQRNARHASMRTTGRYLHKADEERHAETIAAIAITSWRKS